jgi:beta-galactosidase
MLQRISRYSLTRVVLASFIAAALLAAPANAATAVPVPTSPGSRESFNDGWRFFKGDAAGAENPSFDDSQWKDVRLPHDWAIAGPFDSNLNPQTGGLPVSGTGWYRKSFTLPESAKGRYFRIEFDGAMSNAVVWLNGHELGGRPYGYSSFSFDLTPYLDFGAKTNVLAVRLTPEAHASRWYPGAGIYRNVWLDITGPVHVAHWGTYVTTPEVSDQKATVRVRTELRNRLDRAANVSLRTLILDDAGKQISQSESMATVPKNGEQTVVASLTITRPERWDIDHPYLYTLVSEVREGDQAVDKYVTRFGVRTIEFSREKGFLLNGRYLKLHGVCLHSDLGPLGMAVNRRATERELQILKRGGVNAIRTSHNPPSPELLEYADRLGLMVMDEAFDMWRIPKVPNGYSKYFDEWSERDIRDMVRRDRNHPSIILWSIGNEIPEQKEADGWKQAKRLVGFVHEEDPTRPTTSAFNDWDDAIRNHLADQVDVPGFNYEPMHYEQIQEEHPKWVIFGSETESCVSSRGTYQLPIEKYEKDPSHEISSYDIIAPPWAYCPDVEFTYQDRLPTVLGEFVWTGFDYLGEPTPYFGWRPGTDNSHDWPARSSYFGMVDLAGFPKDRYYLYQSVWTEAPMVHVLPHWNWPGWEGKKIPVMVYSNADEVELFLNGKSLGRQKTFSTPIELPVSSKISPDLKFFSKYRLLWEVPYEPGTLKAIAYRGGREAAAEEVHTAGAPAKIELVPDRKAINADGYDLSYITVRIEDKDGNFCPMADNLVHFSLSGAGAIETVGNGNPATTELFQADHRKAFNGLALLIVRSRRGELGIIHVAATSDGLAQAETNITAQPVKLPIAEERQ